MYIMLCFLIKELFGFFDLLPVPQRLMPLAHYYDVGREHSTKYTSTHCLLKNREAAEWYRNAR